MAERRNTLQQDIVYQTLLSLHNHPTADAVYREVGKEHDTISRATVFRILGRMAEEGKILRVPNDRGADSFDHNTQRHCHVRCRECGRIDDVQVKRLPEPEQEIVDACGYEITGHYLLFEGICKECTVT